ncbi:unnamed protein product [Protopolystoma xenopodis]|uniref:Uncharacterized protein n=1 Tax=Protopolystoma xenopodis TaxID=117903 RepID=A0A448WBW8_9PLAT|nr:unnamed protein product [Protopolystoma xenopodis]
MSLILCRVSLDTARQTLTILQQYCALVQPGDEQLTGLYTIAASTLSPVTTNITTPDASDQSVSKKIGYNLKANGSKRPPSSTCIHPLVLTNTTTALELWLSCDSSSLSVVADDVDEAIPHRPNSCIEANHSIRSNMLVWLTCQAHMLHCHGSTPAGGVDETCEAETEVHPG